MFTPVKPIYFKPFIGVISPLITGDGAHLVDVGLFLSGLDF